MIFQTELFLHVTLRKMLQLALIGFFLISSVAGSLYGAVPSQLSPGIDINLAPYVESLEDREGKLSVGDLSRPEIAARFVGSGNKAPNFGFSKSTYWMRFQLKPEWLEGKDTLALIFGYALIDDLRLYLPRDDGTFEELLGGRGQQFHARPLNAHFINFILPEASLSSQRYIYVRGQSSSSHQYPMQLYTLQNFLMKYQEDSLGSRLYMGAIAIMALYNMIFFLMTLDLTYLIYIGFIMVSGAQVLSVQGFSYQYLWPYAVGFNTVSVPFLMCGSVWLTCLFSIKSLQHLKDFRILYKISFLHIPIGLLGCLAAFVLPYATAIKIAVLLTLTSSGFTLVAYAKMSLQRYRPAYFFLISLGALLSASIVYSLKAVGILPYNFFTENAPLIGSAFQVSLLTFGLADRFRELKAQHARMQEQMIELQKDNIRRLDEQVAEKTADIRSILKTIKQGIFTVSGQEMTIDTEKSDALTSMFPETSTPAVDPVHAVFGRSSLDEDSLSKIISALRASLDSDELCFDLNMDCFPRAFEVQEQQGPKRYYECDWSPILDQSDTVKKILVAVRDTTDLHTLEQEAKKRDEEMATISDILAIAPQKFSQAFRAIQRLIRQVREIVNQTQELTTREWQQLYALLHTAKGNARTFGLKKLATIVHNLEDHVKHLSEHWTAEGWEAFRDGLKQLEEAQQAIGRLAEEKLGRSLTDHHMSIASEDWAKLLSSLEDLQGLSPSPKVTSEIELLREQLLRLRFPCMQDIVMDLEKALAKAAQQLHKPAPLVKVEDSLGIFLKLDTAESLHSILVHLLTNCVDHGIESPEQRKAVGKEEQGLIRIQVHAFEGNSVEVVLGDDGAGLALPRLKEMAIAKGLLQGPQADAQAVAETIFASGVSTQTQVSELSGRGVGMDAVRELLRTMEGSIHIRFRSAQPQADRREAFDFVIRLPAEQFWFKKLTLVRDLGQFHRAS